MLQVVPVTFGTINQIASTLEHAAHADKRALRLLRIPSIFSRRPG